MMHRLLKRQLRKIGYTQKILSEKKLNHFIAVVNQAYNDSDEDRALLENILTISSKEMQGLYEQLKQNSESELAKSEAKYRRLVENLQNYYFFYTHDKEGVFTYLSETMTNMLGHTNEEFMTHYSKYMTDDPVNEDVDEYKKNSITGIQTPPYKLSIYHKDGSIIYLEVTELPLFDDNKNVVAIEGIARNITIQHKIQEEISHLAKHDMLTGISNRLHFEEEMKILLAHAKRNNREFAMLFLDLDHFKYINDTLGHDVGDKLLQQITARIKPNIREEDIFARIGGDEFIIVLNNIDEKKLIVILHKIMRLMQTSWIIGKLELNITTSMGISLYPQDGTTSIELMKNADIAMYAAKELGRNNFSFFTQDLNRRVHEEMRLEQDMGEALRQNHFELYYQPIVKVKNNEIAGAEALIRWNHPTRGLIYPDKFVTLSESTGFILKLGKWVIEEGCRALVRFNALCPKKLRLSVNISARQFQQGDLYDIIKSALNNTTIYPQQFAIEITESVMLKNNEKIIKKIDDIKSLGVHVHMDDFGTGYSSLSYLHRLPIDTIKIDKSFVDEITEGKENPILLQTVIAMGKSLNKDVIAEGVEHEYQRQYLLKHGCQFYQGYLFAKPLKESQYCTLFLDMFKHKTVLDEREETKIISC